MPRPRIGAAGIGGSERVGYGVAGSNPAGPQNVADAPNEKVRPAPGKPASLS